MNWLLMTKYYFNLIKTVSTIYFFFINEDFFTYELSFNRIVSYVFFHIILTNGLILPLTISSILCFHYIRGVLLFYSHFSHHSIINFGILIELIRFKKPSVLYPIYLFQTFLEILSDPLENFLLLKIFSSYIL